jgi:hypothetical protein
VGFYTHRNALHVQNLDDAFGAYVWSLLVQQSTVIVGLVPEGITSEVWIAPQASAKRKATAGDNERLDSPSPPKLKAILERKNTSVVVLKEKYGSKLRMAAQPDAIVAAITGSHLRVCIHVAGSNILMHSVVIKVEPYDIQRSADNHARQRCWSVRCRFRKTVRIRPEDVFLYSETIDQPGFSVSTLTVLELCYFDTLIA